MLPFWPDEFTGLWALRLADGDLGRVVVVMVEGDEIAPHAGLQRAAARLERLRILERPPPHTTQSIRPILDAVGGLSPAVPPHPHESFESDARAGIRVVLSEPTDWVRFAASGGHGPVPAADVTGFGVRAPAVRGRMACAIDIDYRLSWTCEERRLDCAAADAVAYPGLYRGTWVNWSRAVCPPLERTID